MRKSFLTVFLLSFLLSCKSPDNTKLESASKKDTTKTDTSYTKFDKKPSRKLGFYTLVGDSVIVPPFEIEISLSPKAKDTIVDSNETIVIDVFLEGTPKDPKKAHLEEDGSFYVGSAKREIVYGQVAKFDNLKFPKKLYDQLADKDADLTVNIYTGRKSSQYNLITGDFLSDKVSNVINRHFTLKQKLIWGDD